MSTPTRLMTAISALLILGGALAGCPDKTTPKDPVAESIKQLSDADPGKRLAAIETLKNSADQRVPAALTARLLQEQDQTALLALISAVRDLKVNDALPPLISLARTRKGKLRRAAAAAVIKIGGVAMLARLRPPKNTRERVMRRMLRFRKKNKLAKMYIQYRFLQALRLARTPESQKLAAEKLIKLNDPRVIPGVIGILEQATRGTLPKELAAVAVSVLKAISGKDFKESVSDWRGYWKKSRKSERPKLVQPTP